MPNHLNSRQIKQAGQILHDLDVSMISCAYWYNKAPWYLKKRRVFDSFFLFPCKGKIRVALEGNEKVLSPGEFLLLPDGVPHAIKLVKGFKNLEQIALHCHIRNTWNLPSLSYFASPFQKFTEKSYWFEQLKRLTCLVNKDSALGQCQGEVFIKNLLFSLVAEGAVLKKPEIEMDARIRLTLQTIHDHYFDDLVVEHLSREVRLGDVQFRKIFRRNVGDSPKAYIASYRLKKATEFLRYSTLSVKEVAHKTGFHNQNYFYLSFRKVFGVTPTEYRNKRRKEI